MNKQEIEKAIKLLKHHVAAWKGKFPSSHFEAYKVAVECMEKQIPATPHQNYYNEGDYNWECICENIVNEGDIFCKHCGQKLLEVKK